MQFFILDASQCNLLDMVLKFYLTLKMADIFIYIFVEFHSVEFDSS
jgi:hypothetical protein